MRQPQSTLACAFEIVMKDRNRKSRLAASSLRLPNGFFYLRLFLDFLKYLAFAGVWVEFRELELSFHLLLILASEDNVARIATELYKVYLRHVCGRYQN